MQCGAVILAGGKSRRMGKEKAGLDINGRSFLDQLAKELSMCAELMVSVEDERLHPQIPYPMVSDLFAGCGPMGGLQAALATCRSEVLVAVPCDVPLFTREIAEGLYGGLDDKTDAVVAVTEDGREHPLCGVYRKSCLPIFQQCLKERNYRMMDALKKLRVKKYQVGMESWRLMNVNTPKDYQELINVNMRKEDQELINVNMRKEDQALQSASMSKRDLTWMPRSCLAICGWKNSGKTTLIEGLVPLLEAEGLQIAVIKHDGHRYEPDVSGTDSARHFGAGACASIVYDAEKYSLTRRRQTGPEALMKLVPEADLFFLEGLKESAYPKLEILQTKNPNSPIPGLKGRLAYVSDIESARRGQTACGGDIESAQKERLGKAPVFFREDISGIAAFILQAYENGTLKERWFDEENHRS